MYRDAVDAMERDTLRCPYCGAQNRPGATYINVEPGQRAACSVCAYEGPIEKFTTERTVKKTP